MTQALMLLMALGALLGGADRILGNRWGLGERFEEAFRLLGPIGLAMAGIICLAPVLSGLLGRLVVPLFTALGLDPGMFGSILTIDMGGYPLAMDLAADPAVGRFSGIIVSAMFGCTVVFTIPVGFSVIGEADRPYFTRGILLGLIVMPAAVISGGLLCGLAAGTVLRNTLPVLLAAALLVLGILWRPQAVARGFRAFAKGIQGVATLGLTLGAVQYMTGWELLPGMAPLSEAMETVCSIGIVMLGSMPLAELMGRLLRRPFAWVSRRTGMNSDSMAGLLIGMVSVAPALTMIPRMDRRGQVVNGAFLVCGASALAAHLGYAAAAQRELVPALLASKFLGGGLGIAAALLAASREDVHTDK